MSEQPNIIFILPDQLRRDFLGCYGANFIHTPHIDSLAAGGVKYDRAISQFPICVPARAALLTGLGAPETGVVDNGKWLRPDRREMGIQTWPELLGQNGYHTASIGKMHFVPWDADEGFKERITSEDKRHYWIQDDYADSLADQGLSKSHGREFEGYAEQKGACINPNTEGMLPDRWVADRTIEFFDRQDPCRPFAAMIGFPSPHCPYDPAQEWLDAIDIKNLPRPLPETEGSRAQREAMIANFKQDWADVDYSDLTKKQIMVLRQHYAALIEAVDREVGRILKALKTHDFARNTIVIFASDHGDFIGDFRLIGKGSFYAPAINIPLIINDMRCENDAKSETAPVSLTDVFATLLDFAGVNLPPEKIRFPSLVGQLDPNRRIFGLCPRGTMLVGPDFKFCRRITGEAEAYDLEIDPNEQFDLVADSSGDPRVAEYDTELTRHLMEGLSQAHNDKSYIESKSADTNAFGRRKWKRPYPQPISHERIRNI